MHGGGGGDINDVSQWAMDTVTLQLWEWGNFMCSTYLVKNDMQASPNNKRSET